MRLAQLGLILFVVLACPPAALAQAPNAEPSADALAEAKRHYDLGRKLYDERDYGAAYAELTRAYEIAPTPNLFYNLGLVHVARRDYAAALTSLENYLAKASAIAPERRQEVETLIESAKGHVAVLEVKTAETGADVFVDDVLIGKTPLEKPVSVNAGEHRVRISKEGRLAARSVIVTGGEKRELELAFESAPTTSETPAPTRVAPEVAPTKPASAKEPPLWIGWVATGALAAGATFTGLRAISKQNELDDQSHERGVTRAELDSTHKQMKTFAVITDVLIVGAVATGGVTLYLSLHKGREGAAKSRLEVGVGPGSAGFRGAF